MRLRQLISVLALGWPAMAGLAPSAAAAQEYGDYALEARVWLDRGAEPVLQRGERARIYYRVSEDAFVGIFHIDTNGAVRMVFPSSPQENHYARAGRDYRVLFPGSSYWYVEDDPGIGYFFIVASPVPFDFRDFGYSHFAGGWDLSGVGRQVYGDPYLAMDDYVASLIPDWEYVAYGLDFTSYHVERHYDYPRFLCYDCHGFQPYYRWNPYLYSCTSFRMVIYSDPYYYPATRYRGTRVVYLQPRRGVARFSFKERAAGEVGTPQVVVRRTPPVSQPGVEGTANRRAVPRSGSPSASSPGGSAGVPSTGGRLSPGVEGGANRRSTPTTSSVGGARPPSSGAPTVGSSPPRGAVRTDPRPATGTGNPSRPVLERRPSGTGGATGTGSATTRPGGSTVTRPSARVRNPGGGGGTTTRTVPTVRPGGGGTTSRTVPTVRPGGGGTTSRTVPTVRPGGGGSTSRTVPTVRSGGSPSSSKPRTSSPPAQAKPKRPPRGGGGGSR